MFNASFFTRVELSKSRVLVNYNSAVLMIGSCFAQCIGEKLSQSKFQVKVNPNGIIYNPISIANVLKRVLVNKPYTENDLFCFNNRWLSFHHHGSYAARDVTSCCEKMNHSLAEAHRYLKSSKVIYVTFGSAWVYEHSAFGVVANCHKLPQKEFKKRLLSVKEVIAAYQELIDILRKKYPTIEMVFTVSPVRHIKDGLHENNLSKSVLHLAVKHLVEQYNCCHYFPAYEIVVDELRDYRFFNRDLVHPNDFAIDYVWDKFKEVYCDERTKTLINKVDKIRQAVAHRPFDYNSEGHQQFINSQLDAMDELIKKHPFLDFTREKEQIQSY